MLILLHSQSVRNNLVAFAFMGLKLMECLKVLVAFFAVECLRCGGPLSMPTLRILLGLACLFPHSGNIWCWQRGQQLLGSMQQACLIEDVIVVTFLSANGTVKTLHEGMLWVGQVVLL